MEKYIVRMSDGKYAFNESVFARVICVTASAGL
jgi:hypothetical protein